MPAGSSRRGLLRVADLRQPGDHHQRHGARGVMIHPAGGAHSGPHLAARPPHCAQGIGEASLESHREPVAALKAARALIADPAHWTRSAFARRWKAPHGNAEGEWVPSARYRSPCPEILRSRGTLCGVRDAQWPARDRLPGSRFAPAVRHGDAAIAMAEAAEWRRDVDRASSADKLRPAGMRSRKLMRGRTPAVLAAHPRPRRSATSNAASTSRQRASATARTSGWLMMKKSRPRSRRPRSARPRPDPSPTRGRPRTPPATPAARRIGGRGHAQPRRGEGASLLEGAPPEARADSDFSGHCLMDRAQDFTPIGRSAVASRCCPRGSPRGPRHTRARAAAHPAPAARPP